MKTAETVKRPRLRDLPKQVPAPGWRVNVALHEIEPLLSRWDRGYPNGVDLHAPFQRPHVWTDAQPRQAFQTVGPEHRRLRLRRPGEERSESISRQDLQIETEVAR